MRENQNEPVQIDPQAYIETLEGEVALLHGETLQLRAAVRHLQAEAKRLQPPIQEGVTGRHPDESNPPE